MRFSTYGGWLALIPNPIISVNEAWFLSNTEKIHALFKKIAEVIDTVNSESELMKKLASVLDDFDDTVADEVKKYIKQMYQSGELDTIIRECVNDWLSTHILAKSDSLTTIRKWRRLNATGINDSFVPNEQYSVNQGGCMYRDINDNVKMAIIQIKKTRATTGIENNQLGIFKTTNQNPERTKVLPIGHGQDICYHNGYLYITHSSENATASSVKITRINEQTLTYSSSNTKEFVGHHPYSITSYNNELLVFDTNNNGVYTLDWSAGTLTIKYILNEINGTVNGMTATRGFLFIAVDETIKVYDIETGTFLWSYNIPDVSTDGYNRGEIESLSTVPTSSNRIAIFSWAQVGLTSGVSQRSLTQMFYVNPITNNLETEYTETDKVSTKQAVLYVCGDNRDSSNPYNVAAYSAVTNPDGSGVTSGGKLVSCNPFMTIQEALDYASNFNNESVNIRLIHHHNRTFTYCAGVNVYIQNYTYQASNYTGQDLHNVTCGGFFGKNGGTLIIKGRSTDAKIVTHCTNTGQVDDFAMDSLASVDLQDGFTLVLGQHTSIGQGSEGYTSSPYGLRANLCNIIALNWDNAENDMTVRTPFIGHCVKTSDVPV